MCMMVLGLVGAAVSAVGSIAAGNAQAAAAQAQANASLAQANLQDRQARAEMMAGQREAANKRKQVDALVAKQRVAYGTAGVLIDGGSPLDVAMDTTREGMLDVGTIQWNAEVKSGNYHYGAAISRMNAQNQMNAADAAKQQGMIGALSGVVGNLGKIGGSMNFGASNNSTSLGFSFG